jgi:hypothetical protein
MGGTPASAQLNNLAMGRNPSWFAVASRINVTPAAATFT